MKLSSIIIVMLAFIMVGCANMGSLKAGHPDPVPVDCLGYLNSTALNRVYTVNLLEKRVYDSGRIDYRVGKGNPFHGQTWIRDNQVDRITCNGVDQEIKR